MEPLLECMLTVMIKTITMFPDLESGSIIKNLSQDGCKFSLIQCKIKLCLRHCECVCYL